MTASHQSVLAAVRKRLAAEPERVLPALRLIADPDALIDPDDEETISLVRTLNAHRIVASLRDLRARSYSTDQVREMLGGVSRQAVSQRVRNGRLISIEISGRSWFPEWQFRNGQPVRGLPEMIKALRASGHDDAWTADGVMTQSLPEEDGRSPAELLASGEIDLALHYVRIAGGGF